MGFHLDVEAIVHLLQRDAQMQVSKPTKDHLLGHRVSFDFEAGVFLGDFCEHV